MGNKALLRKRKSSRLPGYDYTAPGAYFITVSTYKRRPLFGEIVGKAMRRNRLGQIVQQAWEDLPNHYPHVRLGAFMVMPNHVHGIVILEAEPDFSAPSRCTGRSDEGTGRSDGCTGRSETVQYNNQAARNPKRHGLPEIVRAFKSFSARRINELRGTPGARVWHRSYYDRIIRNEREWARIRAYILDNPRRWAEDRFAPQTPRQDLGQDSAAQAGSVRAGLRPARTTEEKEEESTKKAPQGQRPARRNREALDYGE